MLELEGARRLHCFTLGYEPIRESVSLLGGDDNKFLLEPVTATAVSFDNGWILLDTGFNIDVIRDPQKRAAHFNYESYTALVQLGDPLMDQVEVAGLKWDDLKACAVSHLHCDHSGGLRLVPAGVPIFIQRAERDFAMNEATLEDVYFRQDYAGRESDFELLEGYAEIAPGVEAMPTFGHTPGHMSFRISLKNEYIVLACDAADLMLNITASIPCGTTTHESLAEEARRSTHLLTSISEEPGVSVWPGHDPDFWSTRKAPSDPYT